MGAAVTDVANLQLSGSTCEEPSVKICVKFCPIEITRCCCVHTVVCVIGKPVETIILLTCFDNGELIR